MAQFRKKKKAVVTQQSFAASLQTNNLKKLMNAARREEFSQSLQVIRGRLQLQIKIGLFQETVHNNRVIMLTTG